MSEPFPFLEVALFHKTHPAPPGRFDLFSFVQRCPERWDFGRQDTHDGVPVPGIIFGGGKLDPTWYRVYWLGGHAYAYPPYALQAYHVCDLFPMDVAVNVRLFTLQQELLQLVQQQQSDSCPPNLS